jgi:uncharacterized protein (TIGR04255 family)
VDTEKTKMELGAPPVIEVGIEFHFDPRPDRAPWTLQVAGPFVERFQTTFPNVEVVQSEEVQIERRSPGGLPEKITGKINLDRVRAHNAEGARWIQVGNDLLVFSLIRQQQNYPGFEQVRVEAMEVLDSYIEHFQPASVRRAALTYLDQVEIPIPSGSSGVRLEDYFRLRPEFPDPDFGGVGAFALQMQFPNPEQHEPVTVLLQTAPAAPGSGICRFQMHWHCLCEDVRSLDKEEISRRLETARVRLRKCFRASFTPLGWALFQPAPGS